MLRRLHLPSVLVLVVVTALGCGSPSHPVAPPPGAPASASAAPAVSAQPAPAPLAPVRDRYQSIVAAEKQKGFSVAQEVCFGDEACAVTFQCVDPDCDGAAIPFVLLAPGQTLMLERGEALALAEGTEGYRFDVWHKGDLVIVFHYHMPAFATGAMVYEYDRSARSWVERRAGGPDLPWSIESAEPTEYIDDRPVFRRSVVSLLWASFGPYSHAVAYGSVFEVWDGTKFSTNHAALRDLYVRKLAAARAGARTLPQTPVCLVIGSHIEAAVKIFTLAVATGTAPQDALREADRIFGSRSTAHCISRTPGLIPGSVHVPELVPWSDLRKELLDSAAKIPPAFAAPAK